MPKQIELSVNSVFVDGDRLIGYGACAEGIDSCDIERYLWGKVAISAVSLNTTTNILTFTLADGTEIEGTVTT